MYMYTHLAMTSIQLIYCVGGAKGAEASLIFDCDILAIYSTFTSIQLYPI